MIQSSHRFGLAASSPNLSESSLAGRVPVLRLRCAQPRTVRALVTRALRAHPPNWIQTNLAPRDEAKPVGLIKSFGAPPPPPGYGIACSSSPSASAEILDVSLLYALKCWLYSKYATSYATETSWKNRQTCGQQEKLCIFHFTRIQNLFPR